MKLHLPVRLFRAVIALMAVAMPFSASAARKYSVSDGQQLTLSGYVELDLDISEYYVSSTYSEVYGGAIDATGTGSVTIRHYGSVLFNKNYAKASVSHSYGGAIYSYSGDITLSGNKSVTFSGNYSSADDSSYGGAICSSGGDITLSGNGSVTFSDNYAYSSDYFAYGGAIDGENINIRDNESVTFSGNYAYSSSSASYSYGGAIYSKSGDITLSGNESVTFSDNYAYSSDYYAYGGAIYSESGAITLSGNESVTFSGNYASTSASYSSSSYYSSYGGAIYSESGAITLSGNKSVTFSGNYTISGSSNSRGGAINSYSGAITLSGNKSVTFSGNYAESSSYYSTSYGGAIYSKSGAITLSGNESVTFSGNYAICSSSISTSYGGAIYGKNINIRDNGSVVFKQNYEMVSSTDYRLRGLYATGNTALSAASGNYIEFQESMYVGGVLELNNLYTNASGKSVAQTGDIIFTGGYAAEYLGAIKSDYTAEELNNSRTSNVSGMTTLYDGRLIVRDGAILRGAGLTVVSSASGYSTPTVLIKNAKLNHARATVSFASGTRLEASGQSGIDCNNLTMGSGSDLTLHAAGGNMSAAVLSVYGSFTMGDSLTLNISFNDDTAEAGTYKLLQVTTLNDSTNWTSDKITVNGLDGTTVKFEDLYWADNVLWLTYSGNIPELTVATWSNESGDGEWNTSSRNWAQDSYDYAYVDGVAVVFGDTGAGEVKLVGNLTPSSVLVDSSADYTWSGDGCICGATALSKLGSGTLTINNANSYTGGTVLKEGDVYAFNDDALGTGTISCSGNAGIYVGSDNKLNLYSTIQNSGQLLLYGAFDVSALEATPHSLCVDAEGKLGAGGFGTQGGYTVQMVQGGSLTNLATVYRGADQLTLGDDGTAVFLGTVDYTRYTVADGSNTSLAAIRQAATQHGAAKTSVTTIGGALLMNDAVSGNLTLSGGTVVMENSTVAVSGSLVLGDAVQLSLQGKYVAGVEYTLISAAGISGDVQGWTVTGTHPRQAYTLYLSGNSLMMDVESFAATLTWANAKKAVWQDGAGGWEQGESFYAGDSVIFRDGTVSIVGEVQPGEIDVAVAKSLSFKTTFNKKTGEYSGAIVGDDTSLTIAATTTKGKVTMNDGNRYGGGTTILSGTVSAGGALSFGTGDITLKGGTLDLKSKAVSNVIFLEGAGVIKGGKKFLGSLAMAADLLKGSQLNIVEGQSATIFSGTVNGTISGEGEVLVTYRPETGYPAPQLGTTGKITTNSLRLMEDSVLLVSDKGLVMNSKASAITIEGGTLSSAGKISAYSLSMTGGTLDVTNAKPMGITLKDAFVATDGADIDLYGGLTANQLTLEGVDFTLAMDAADIAPKVQPKAQSITLKGKGVLNTVSDSELDIAGKVSVTGDLALLDSVVMLHDVAGAAKPKAQGLTVKGVLISDGTELVTTGAVSAAALTASESVIAIAAEEGLAAQSLKLTRKDATKGVPQENILSDSVVYVNGSMSVAGNLQLQESYMMLRDYSGKKKAMGLSVKGDLSLSSDSYLKLTGALSAKNLTLDAGSYLMLGSAKLSTVKVGGALTLKGEVNFDLGFTVTEKDVAKGKEYTLFSFKSLVGDVSNLTLGYEGEYTLALNAKGTAITLTVTDAAAWNAYVADIQESLNAAPAVADAVGTPEEEVEAEELLLKPVAATTDIDPLLAKVADTLVQSTWGTVGASRAFGETIAGRGRNATLLDDGKGAAWLSVMGGSSRISSAEGHNGADFTLSGAAFGVESRVGEKSTLGVAIGNSWGKVSTFSAFPVDQDSMHVGIYGNHTLTKSLTLNWMATHTRTESDATILGAPYSWSQDALQLDARLTWGKSISDKTAVSAFAGLQYLATDSGECAGLKTGSLQNLRVELGVGASHKCSDSTLVFGELSFIGDMVRNNPTAAIGDYRTHGTNPGRVGLNLSVGAQHQLSEDWSLNASYSLELMENSTSHSLNVGASYSF